MRVPIKVAARGSPLSRAQVQEFSDLIPQTIEAFYVDSHGDLDRKTSLRDIPKNDFFTREVDELVLSGRADIALHSAKDLPQNLPEGLKIIALTKGRDSSDSLVIREDAELKDIKKVATSSFRREEAVRQLKGDIEFCDIRGLIHERLEKLYQGEVDGVVIAEAALLRLGLNPKRIKVPGETTPLQGQLAVLCRLNDHFPEIERLDTRPKEVLYLGLRCPDPMWHHFPIIETLSLPFYPVESATHYILTSRTAAKLYRPYLMDRPIFCTGRKTAEEIAATHSVFIAKNECAEGVVELLKETFNDSDLSQHHFVWPRAEGARPVISEWIKKKAKLTEIPLYTTRPTNRPPIDFTPFKKIVFTSPSCVNAFIEIYGQLPQDILLEAIGPVTESCLKSHRSITVR